MREGLVMGIGLFVSCRIEMVKADTFSVSRGWDFYTLEERSLCSHGIDCKSRAVVSRGMNPKVGVGRVGLHILERLRTHAP